MGRRNVWLAIVSVFVGPLIGALTFMAVTSAMDAVIFQSDGSAYGFLRGNWPVVLMAGYMFGAIPGLVFAVMMIVLSRHIPRPGQRLFGAALGGMDWVVLTAMAASGAVAGVASLALVEWFHPLPSKPAA